MSRTLKRLFAVMLTLTLLCPALGLSEEEEHPVVCISVKDIGKIYAELYPEYAPITVENFLNLANAGFYDGLTFHRIISGFMIQGGDPLGNGTGGSKKNIKGEFSANGVDNPLTHERGVLSMARNSDMNSASSQFFIMHETSPHLDGSYAAFGRVLAGQWAVDRICQETPVQDGNGTVLKENQPVMESIRLADRAEAEEALRLETENGKSGTVYLDPVSPLSFPVPQGWNRAENAGSVIFQREGAEDKPLTIDLLNYWGPLDAAAKKQMEANGLNRQALDTEVFRAESLIGLIAPQNTGKFSEETHADVLFYAVEAPAGNGVSFVGANDGFIYVFSFGGGSADPLYAEVQAILDSLVFREAY